jgi:hypothetical protein
MLHWDRQKSHNNTDHEQESQIEEDHDKVACVICIRTLFGFTFELTEGEIVVLENYKEKDRGQNSGVGEHDDGQPGNGLEIQDPDDLVRELKLRFPLLLASDAPEEDEPCHRYSHWPEELDHKLCDHQFEHVFRAHIFSAFEILGLVCPVDDVAVSKDQVLGRQFNVDQHVNDQVHDLGQVVTPHLLLDKLTLEVPLFKASDHLSDVGDEGVDERHAKARGELSDVLQNFVVFEIVLDLLLSNVDQEDQSPPSHQEDTVDDEGEDPSD